MADEIFDDDQPMRVQRAGLVEPKFVHLATIGRMPLCSIAGIHDPTTGWSWNVRLEKATCERCRVVADWALEHAVKMVKRQYALRGPMATATFETLRVFDGRSLSAMLLTHPNPFKRISDAAPRYLGPGF